MAIVTDEARSGGPSAVVDCATSSFVQPTPRTYPRSFSILSPAAETHIDTPDGEPTDNTGDTWVPVIYDVGFWLTSSPKTVRFT